MSQPYKQPVSVLVVIHTPQLDVLLLERAGNPGLWQSVTGSREGDEALATLGKGNVASLHRSRRSRQTFSNGYAAFKVAVPGHIPQLVCQRIQYFADIIFLCSCITFGKALADAVVAGVKHHLGAGLSIKNLNITADNVTRCSIIMLIPYLGNTFGISNMDRIAIIYLNNTGR